MSNIFIVDDSMTTRSVVDDVLTNAGFNVTACDSGMDALSKINTFTNKISLFILDVNMPGMDGISLISEIRKIDKCKFTPILMLTTESDDSKKMEGKKAGASGWFVKPFDPEQLINISQRFAK